jgi:hypothetical protein
VLSLSGRHTGSHFREHGEATDRSWLLPPRPNSPPARTSSLLPSLILTCQQSPQECGNLLEATVCRVYSERTCACTGSLECFETWLDPGVQPLQAIYASGPLQSGIPQFHDTSLGYVNSGMQLTLGRPAQLNCQPLLPEGTTTSTNSTGTAPSAGRREHIVKHGSIDSARVKYESSTNQVRIKDESSTSQV